MTDRPVHYPGGIRPFALCHSVDPYDPRTRDEAGVTCPGCLEKLRRRAEAAEESS